MPSTARRRLVSVQAAATDLGVSEKTIRRYISSGKLEGFRMGARLIRVDMNQVDRLLSPIGAYH